MILHYNTYNIYIYIYILHTKHFNIAVQRGNRVAVVGSLRGSLDWGLEGFLT